jgi:dipeptidase E
MRGQVIAMGGGGFSMEPGNLALDRYVVQQAIPKSGRPQVCFLPTASGDAEPYILHFYEAFTSLDCVPSSLSLFRLPAGDLEGFILEKDVLYVGGGNTRSMLALWREWGLDRLLLRACEQGALLAGISAGANCWFEQCSTDSIPGRLTVLDCLGYLPGSFCPHYDGEVERRPSFQRMVSEGEIQPGYACDDGTAVHFVDGQLVCAVRSRPNAQAYWLEPDGAGGVVEQPLDMIDVF